MASPKGVPKRSLGAGLAGEQEFDGNRSRVLGAVGPSPVDRVAVVDESGYCREVGGIAWSAKGPVVKTKSLFRFGVVPASLGVALPIGVVGISIRALGHRFSVLELFIAGTWLLVPLAIELAIFFKGPVPAPAHATGRQETTVGLVLTGVLLAVLNLVAGRLALVAFLLAWVYLILVTLSGRALDNAPQWINRSAPTYWLFSAWLLFLFA